MRPRSATHRRGGVEVAAGELGSRPDGGDRAAPAVRSRCCKRARLRRAGRARPSRSPSARRSRAVGDAPAVGVLGQAGLLAELGARRRGVGGRVEVVAFEQHLAQPDVHVGGAPHHAVVARPVAARPRRCAIASPSRPCAIWMSATAREQPSTSLMWPAAVRLGQRLGVAAARRRRDRRRSSARGPSSAAALPRRRWSDRLGELERTVGVLDRGVGVAGDQRQRGAVHRDLRREPGELLVVEHDRRRGVGVGVEPPLDALEERARRRRSRR